MKSSRIALRLLATAALLAGCTSHSPSEPQSTPSTPKPPVPTVTYNITVTANPPQLAVGTTGSSNITISVHRADNGQPPPDLTPVTLSTTLGLFGSVNGTQQISLQLLNGQAQTVLFPGATAGTATIRAQVDTSVGAADVAIGSQAAFFVGSVSPGTGDPQGGTLVTILGGGFVSPVRVTFGNAAATVRSVSPNKIVAVLPSATAAGVTVGVGQSVPVAVSVTINANQPGAASDSLPNGFTYALGGSLDQPQIFSVTPSSGPNDGGTRVTITGTGFDTPVQVFFETGSGASRVGVEASVISVTKNQIIVLTPAARGFGEALANQAADIRVKNLNSGFETTDGGAFRFGSKVLVTSVRPSELPFNDTTTQVTVFGQGFESPAAVGLAGVAARPLTISGTEIVVQSPGINVTGCADVRGAVTEVNINTGDGGSGPDFIWRVPKTIITSVSPNSSSENGGITVTISGQGFDGTSRVQFGSQTAVLLSATSNQLTVSVPAFTGTFPTKPCTVGSSTGTQNVPASVDVKVTTASTTCTDTASNAFIYNPNDVSCHVAPPPAPTASFVVVVNMHTASVADTSTGNPTSWMWNFGDGFTFNGQNPPPHTYAVPGMYIIKLTVSNANGSSSTTQTVTIM
ncbi:MAG TPA: IPT/TIG domain-containing protein [Thermoanaerobaculia bacterium]|nr:IPT/TIG domain-containing protein [Thermoanaerobaculia bacterium]